MVSNNICVDFSLVDIIFALNDPKRGPTALYYESNSDIKDPSLPLKVAVKSQLTLSLMDRDAVVSQSDAVLPFPDISKISFSFLFTMHSESGNITGSFSYLVPQNENIALYRKIPALKAKMQEISNAFQSFIYKSDTALPKEYVNLLNGLFDFEQPTKPSTAVKEQVEITTEHVSGTPDYLLKKVKKNLEFVFFNLLVERPIIVTGRSRIAVGYAIASLEFLTPHRTLKKIIFSEDYVDSKQINERVDVIGVSSIHEKQYLKEFIVVDVDKFEIHGDMKGNKTFFKDFINKIKNQDSETIQQDLRIFITDLLDTTHKITDLFATNENVSKEKINNLTRNLKSDEREAIVEISATYNPLIADKIRADLGSKVSGWLDDFS